MIRFTKKSTSPAPEPTGTEKSRLERIREDAAEARKKSDSDDKRSDKATVETNRRP